MTETQRQDTQSRRDARAALKADAAKEAIDVRRAELEFKREKLAADQKARAERTAAIEKLAASGLPPREAPLLRLAVEMDNADLSGDRINAAIGYLRAQGWIEKDKGAKDPIEELARMMKGLPE